MNIINLNSKIVNATPPAWAAEQTQLGRDRFHAGEQITNCTTAEQRKGFIAALNADADADTALYLMLVRS